MKKLIGAAFLILLAFSCKKDAGKNPVTDIYLHSVLLHLRDSISAEDFSRLDTTRAYLTNSEKSRFRTLRLAFAGKPLSGDFMLLRTDETGNILRGQVIHLESDGPSGGQFSGNIRLSAFSGHVNLQSTITNGSIDALHAENGRGNQLKAVDGKTVTLEPAPPADLLPEVIVIGYSSGASPTPYINLDGIIGSASAGISGSGGGGAGGGSGSAGGSPSSGGGGNGGTGSGRGSGPVYSPLDPNEVSGGFSRGAGLIPSPSLEVEPDYVNAIPVVDIRKMFNCFDLVPNDGATFSIQLCADVPANSNPDVSMNFSGTVNAGHVFLVVTKFGSGVAVTQSFGYYPQSAPSAWNPFSPLPAAIKDNKGQEINASISMSMNSTQFDAVKAAAITLSTQAYQLDKSNCTDYALNVFNAARAVPLTMDPYLLRQAGIVMANGLSSPSITVSITNSPQKLYAKLSSMKSNGGDEAGNIQLDLSHNLKAPISHGECN
jgi:hypothetical protein